MGLDMEETIRTRIYVLENLADPTRDETELLEAFRHTLTALTKRSILNQFKDWLDTENLAYTIYNGTLDYSEGPATLESMQELWKAISADLDETIRRLSCD